jgi:hypothetical protein
VKLADYKDDPDADGLTILMTDEVARIFDLIAEGITPETLNEILEIFADGGSRAERWQRP